VRALIVDDSKAMRIILGRILAELGFEIVETPNGRAAFDRVVAEGAMDLALVDWGMPEMSGYELLCALRADQAYARMPVIVVSTETETAQLRRALEAGASEYLMKPFTREALLEKLALLHLLPG
jgi:two-component system chemotaxis response regulator CheY